MITRKKITQHQQRIAVQIGNIQRSSLQSSQSGFTIIESLMAIVVVTILMIGIAPVITLSVASRVQARRVELATQAAKAYIDGLTSGTISPTPSTTNNLNTFAAPTSPGGLATNCAANSYCSSMPDLYCVVVFGNYCDTGSRTDMLVQAFRLNSTSTDPDKGYRLGLRVYRSDAFKDSDPLKTSYDLPNLDKKLTQATFTRGVGNRKRPLVEMTTEIVVTDKTKYRDICARLGGGSCQQ